MTADNTTQEELAIRYEKEMKESQQIADKPMNPLCPTCGKKSMLDTKWFSETPSGIMECVNPKCIDKIKADKEHYKKVKAEEKKYKEEYGDDEDD